MIRRLSAENEGESTRTEGELNIKDADPGGREGSTFRRRTEKAENIQSDGFSNKDTIEG